MCGLNITLVFVLVKNCTVKISSDVDHQMYRLNEKKSDYMYMVRSLLLGKYSK